MSARRAWRSRRRHAAADLFVDDVLFVPLAAVRDPSLVLSTIGQALGYPRGCRGTLGDRLRVALADRDMLLVLDKFEQVADAAPAVAELLVGCPALKGLVTSRARLRIAGEHEYPLAALAIPGETSVLRRSVVAMDAVRLFVERAQAVKPGFNLTEGTRAGGD